MNDAERESVWFVYDQADGMRFFESEEAARENAEQQLRSYRDQSHLYGEWFEEVETLCWGKLSAQIEPFPKTDDNGDEFIEMRWREFG